MSETRPSIIMDRIRNVFRSMGRDSGPKATHPPASLRNTDMAAWELHVSTELEREAVARKKLARAEAIEAGVMFDHEAEPMAPGTECILYDGDIVQVQVKVNNTTTAVDHKAFKNALEAAGVKPAVIAEAEVKSMKVNRPAHIFKTIVKGGAMVSASK